MSTRPVTLFPLRLEMRWETGSNGAPRALVRWYPDACQLPPPASGREAEGAPMPLLPDHVELHAFSEGGSPQRIAIGAPIPASLRFRAPSGAARETGKAWSWIFDFGEAVTNGMAVRIEDAGAVKTLASARWLFAVGVAAKVEGRSPVADLLHAHVARSREIVARGRGRPCFQLLARGTPTNDTLGAKAGAPAPWPGLGLSGTTHVQSLARTLGVPEATFIVREGALDIGLDGAGAPAFALSRAAIRLLTPFCERALGAKKRAADFFTDPSAPDVEGAVRAAIDELERWGSPRGDAPALRIGDNPYGLALVRARPPLDGLPLFGEALTGMPPSELSIRLVRLARRTGRFLRRNKDLPPPSASETDSPAAPFEDEAPEARLEAILQQSAVSTRLDVLKAGNVHERVLNGGLVDPEVLEQEQLDGLLAALRDVKRRFGSASAGTNIDDLLTQASDAVDRRGPFEDWCSLCRARVAGLVKAIRETALAACRDALRAQRVALARWVHEARTAVEGAKDLDRLADIANRKRPSPQEIASLVALPPISKIDEERLAALGRDIDALAPPARFDGASIDASAPIAGLVRAAEALSGTSLGAAGQAITAKLQARSRDLAADADGLAADVARQIAAIDGLRSCLAGAGESLRKLAEKVVRGRTDGLALHLGRLDPQQGPRPPFKALQRAALEALERLESDASDDAVAAEWADGTRLLVTRLTPPARSAPDLAARKTGLAAEHRCLKKLLRLRRRDLAWTSQTTALLRMIALSADQMVDSGDAARRQAFRSALDLVIAGLEDGSVSPRELESLLFGALDAFGHRLDVWATARSAALLSDLRGEGTSDNQHGVYGFLESPGAPARPAAASEYFQAPSIDQGKAVAVLRAGSLTHARGLQLDLSSDRARGAEWVLAELRSGAPLEDVLLRRIAREVHAAQADALLPDLREAFPQLVADWLDSPAEGRDPGSLGAALTNALSAALDATPGLRARWNTACSRAMNAVDAVADLAVAEAVYQHLRGNRARERAVLDAVAGKGLPPEPEITRTRRTGERRIERVILPTSCSEPAARGEGISMRSLASPGLSALAQKLLGRLDDVTVRLDLSPRAAPKRLRLGPDLRMSAIDLVIGGEAEIHARAALFLALSTIPLLDRGEAQITAARVTVEPGARAAELLGRARSFARLIALSRPLTPEHIEGSTGAGAAALQKRFEATRAALARRAGLLVAEAQELYSKVADPPNLGLHVARGLLFRLLGLGMSDVVTRYLEQRTFEGAARARLSSVIGALSSAWASLDTTALTLALATSCGPEPMPILPTFTAASWPVLPSAKDDHPVKTLPMIRKALSLLGEIAPRDTGFELSCGGRPPRTGPADGPESGPPGLQLHVYALRQTGSREAPFVPGGSVAGLVVDEWQEITPSEQEATAVVFRCETTRAEAPNALLVGVPERDQPPWTCALVASAVAHGVTLMQLRTLTTEDLLSRRDLREALPHLDLGADLARDLVLAEEPSVLAIAGTGDELLADSRTKTASGVFLTPRAQR